MHWQDTGIVLGARRHGETSIIAELLTVNHGRHLGLVRGGRSRRLRPVLQVGNRVMVRWNARLPEHLGTFQVELVAGRAAALIEDAAALAVLNTLSELCRLLAEREPHPDLFAGLDALLDVAQTHCGIETLAELLARFELRLLDEFGFGLDLSQCAATGRRENLAFVSPKTGRAVSFQAGAPYRSKLLPLPAFLTASQQRAPDRTAILEALQLTGFFLQKHLFMPEKKSLPEARSRIERLLLKA